MVTSVVQRFDHDHEIGVVVGSIFFVTWDIHLIFQHFISFFYFFYFSFSSLVGDIRGILSEDEK